MVSGDVRVRVHGGTLTGTTHAASEEQPRAVEAFYGIPYGRVPRRFAVAKAVGLDQVGELDARKKAWEQPHMRADVNEVDEGTLRLNVFRLASEKRRVSTKYGGSAGNGGNGEDYGAGDYVSAQGKGVGPAGVPVVVYIHGGGYTFGSPLDRSWPSFLAHGGRDVIVVAAGYRMGPLGFLAGETEVPNLGLTDQRLAIEWTARWAGVFGGDGSDLTLMGWSAGAHSVGHHMVSPSSPRFRRAILESGGPTCRSVQPWSCGRVTSQVSSFRKQVASLGGSSHTPLASQPLERLLEAGRAAWDANEAALTWPFQPVWDPRCPLLPASPVQLCDAFAQSMSGRGRAVVAGFCANEGTAFVQSSDETLRAFFSTLVPGLTGDDLDQLEALYGGVEAEGRLAAAYGDYAYKAPVLHTAHVLWRAGARVFLYEYAAAPGLHGGQLPSTVGHGVAPGQRTIAAAMNARWADFVAGELPPRGWPAFASPFGGGDSDTGAGGSGSGSGRGELLVFGEGNDEGLGGSDRGQAVKTRRLSAREIDICRFWWARMELSHGRDPRASL